MNPAALKFRWQEAFLSDPSLSNVAKVFGGYLTHRLDGELLEVEMAAETIAQDLKWSLSTVKRAISEFRKKWILVVKGRYANRYVVNLRHVEAAQARLTMLREARKARRQLEADQALQAQIQADRGVKSDPSAGSEVTTIPSKIPSQSSQGKESPRNKYLKAVPHRFAAESELVRLLGDGDEDRGLEISNFIGQHHFDRLHQALQQGVLTVTMLKSAATPALIYVASKSPGGDRKNSRSTPCSR